MSRFFEQEEETKELLPPDYSEAESPTEDDDDDEESSITDIDEAQEDDIINTKEEEKKVVTTTTFGTQATPFGNTATTGTTPWGAQSTTPVTPAPFSGPSWGTSTATTPPQNVWSQPQTPPRPTWSASTSGTTWGASSTTSMTGKVEIDRSKKVIVTDFLDVIVETLQSNGSPGLIPRDIYDLKHRIDVWAKFLAYSPERVYILAPINLLMGTSGSPLSWQSTINYFSICLASFLRIPYQSCPVIAMDMIGVRKSDIIKPIIAGIEPKDVVMVGVNSGLYGQSNLDSMAALECGIDYVDLTALLNNMY